MCLTLPVYSFFSGSLNVFVCFCVPVTLLSVPLVWHESKLQHPAHYRPLRVSHARSPNNHIFSKRSRFPKHLTVPLALPTGPLTMVYWHNSISDCNCLVADVPFTTTPTNIKICFCLPFACSSDHPLPTLNSHGSYSSVSGVRCAVSHRLTDSCKVYKRQTMNEESVRVYWKDSSQWQIDWSSLPKVGIPSITLLTCCKYSPPIWTAIYMRFFENHGTEQPQWSKRTNPVELGRRQ